ncbi:MAG: IPT/TIG domain-containing protein [Proteobacteria bacterium]|nr:IPT/TIG domain-containing protein [Pseudomonadota bacterium]
MRARLMAALIAAILAGCSGSDGPTPKITSPNGDAPAVVCPGCADPAARTFEIAGGGFSPVVDDSLDAADGMELPTVVLIDPEGVEAEVPADGVTYTENTGDDVLTVVLPLGFVPPTEAGQPEVLYDLRVVNPNGNKDRVGAAVRAIAPADQFAITGIDPPFGWTGAPTTVTILSTEGFASTPTAFMKLHGAPDTAEIPFENVAFIDSSTLTAVVPAGSPIGVYDVTVTNPPAVGPVGFLDSGFKVVSQPVPTIIVVVPERGTGQQDTNVSIFGDNFRDPVTVELIDADGNTAVTIAELAPVDAHRIDTVFPTSTQSADLPTGVYLVRVTDQDEATYSTYSAFLVTNPAGNLNVFETVEGPTIGRRMPAGAFARDVLGNRYVYAIGGDTGDGGEALDTVELSQLSKFGALASWNVQRSPLTTPRAAAAAVAVPVYDEEISPYVPVKTYLYVIGGFDDSGMALDTVERAVVLDPVDSPVDLEAEATPAGGDLAAGAWYYRVAAIVPASDPDNPGGETLASEEVVVTLPEPGAVSLSWTPTTIGGAPAAGYRVYRTDEADGVSKTEHQIAEVTDTAYTDAGDAAGTAPPQFLGATGVFVVDDSALGAGRLGLRAVLAHDETGARFVFALGGMSSTVGGSLDAVEIAAVAADGHLGDFATTGATPLDAPRAFFDAVLEDAANVSGYALGGSRLWVMGGLDAAGAPTGSLSQSDVAAGANGAWVPNDKTVQSAAGVMAVIANNKLFCLGGAAAASWMSFSNVTPNGRDTEFDDAGDITGSINSTANGLLAPRALGAAVQGAGFIYYFGGTSDGLDALATAERTY